MKLVNLTGHNVDLVKGSICTDGIHYSGGKVYMTIPSDGAILSSTVAGEKEDVDGIAIYEAPKVELKNPDVLPDSGNVIVPAFLVGLVKAAKPGLTVYTVGPMSFDGRERLGAIGLIKN